MVAREIMARADVLGRMPTHSEVPNTLSSVIARRGGYAGWADRLGLQSKASETLLGRGIEGVVSTELRSRGHTVERQTVKAPFDLLVNGVTRIDVKAANYGEWAHRNGTMVRGYVFAGLKRGKDSDVFILACLRDEKPFAYFVVPAPAATVHTVTITPGAFADPPRTKWAPYRDRFDLIPAPAAND
jgi:hypothetical protein